MGVAVLIILKYATIVHVLLRTQLNGTYSPLGVLAWDRSSPPSEIRIHWPSAAPRVRDPGFPRVGSPRSRRVDGDGRLANVGLAIYITPGINHRLYSVAQAELAGTIFDSGPRACFRFADGVVLPAERHGLPYVLVARAR